MPGARTRAENRGLVTVAAARLPFGDGYRMPASLTKWETVLETLAPDERLNDNTSALVRVDYNLAEDHSLMLRGDWRGYTYARRLRPLAP